MSSNSLGQSNTTKANDDQPPGYTVEPRGKRTSTRKESLSSLSNPPNHFLHDPTLQPPTRAVKHRKVCGLHVTTATILVCVMTIIIQVVPFMMIGGIFIARKLPGTEKPMMEGRALKAFLAVGVILFLEAGGLLVSDVILLLGVMMDHASRIIPYVIMQVITILTGIVIAVLAVLYNVTSVVEVMIYYGVAALFNVVALYTVISCYLEMKEQERMYKYFAARMAELQEMSRNAAHNMGRFSSTPVRLPSTSPPTPSPASDQELNRRPSPSDEPDAVGRSLPRSSRLHVVSVDQDQLTYPDAMDNTFPWVQNKQGVTMTTKDHDRSSTATTSSQAYWSPSKDNVGSMEPLKEEADKPNNQKSTMASKSSFFGQTSSESTSPTSKSSLKPSKRPSGGSWAYNVMDLLRPHTSESAKSTRDLPSLQYQWQVIQETLASQSESKSHSVIMTPPNAPPGNKASFPVTNPSKVPPGSKASFSGSIANIPPGNKAMSFTAPSPSFSFGGSSPSGSGHKMYPSAGHALHPSSGHTLHSVPGRPLHQAPGHTFPSTNRTQIRDSTQRMSQRRFSANEATIIEENSLTQDPVKDKKGQKENKPKAKGKERKKK